MFDDVSVDTCKYALFCYVGRNMHGARHFLFHVSLFLVQLCLHPERQGLRIRLDLCRWVCLWWLENQIGLVQMSLSVVAFAVSFFLSVGSCCGFHKCALSLLCLVLFCSTLQYSSFPSCDFYETCACVCFLNVHVLPFFGTFRFSLTGFTYFGSFHRSFLLHVAGLIFFQVSFFYFCHIPWLCLELLCQSFSKRRPFLCSFAFSKNMHFIYSHSFHNHFFINSRYDLYVCRSHVYQYDATIKNSNLKHTTKRARQFEGSLMAVCPRL